MPDGISAETMHAAVGLSDEQAIELYRLMLLTRALDGRIWALNRQGRVGITAPCRGHEAAQVGLASAFQPGRDVFLPYYRDLGVLVTLGFSPLQLMLDALGKVAGPFTAGRQMPFHWTRPELRILSPSSSVATQLPHAVGAALACQRRGERAVTLVTFGDGASSKSDFHQALSFAQIWKLPVIFVCENNQYAISVPLSQQMAVPSVAVRAAAYGLSSQSIDGNDLLAVYAAARDAVAAALNGSGPIFIEALTYRLLPHTSNDDDSVYRSPEEVEAWRARDPLPRYAAYLERTGLLGPRQAEALAGRIAQEVEQASEQALASPEPLPASALDHLFAPGTPNAPKLDPDRVRFAERLHGTAQDPIRSEITA